MKTLSERMVLFRAKNKLTQEKFAELCELSKQTICLVESGKKEPSRFTRAKIELVLGGDVEDENGR